MLHGESSRRCHHVYNPNAERTFAMSKYKAVKISKHWWRAFRNKLIIGTYRTEADALAAIKVFRNKRRKLKQETA
jgi:hypothetical protein